MFDTGLPHEVQQLAAELLATEDDSCTPAQQVDRIAGWERVIAHAQAQQLAEMENFAQRRRTGGWAERAAESTKRTYDSVNDEIAMARRISPVTAALQLSMAQILANDLPECYAAFDAGRIGLHAVRMIVAETDVLTPEQRRSIDPAIAAEAAGLTPGQVRDAVRARVLAADAAAADKRASKVRSQTCVGMVKRADGVGMIYANLKAEDALAVHDALDSHARTLRAAGDERSLGRLRVDAFVNRLTSPTAGRAGGDEAPETDAPGAADDVTSKASDPEPRRRVTLNVVVSAATVLGLDNTPGMLTGYGHISPAVVRDILDGPETWVRRLVADPIDGQVLTIDSRARRVTGLLRTFTDTRDGVCRRPFCSNPIDDGDHIDLHSNGGRTNHRNIDGLCEPCHLTRHQHGWTLTPEAGTNRVWWTTPTGHTYDSEPPPAIGYGTLSHRLLRMVVQHGNQPPPQRRTAA